MYVPSEKTVFVTLLAKDKRKATQQTACTKRRFSIVGFKKLEEKRLKQQKRGKREIWSSAPSEARGLTGKLAV